MCPVVVLRMLVSGPGSVDSNAPSVHSLLVQYCVVFYKRVCTAAMLQVYTHCFYSTVWYTTSVCVLLLAHPCVRSAVGLYHSKVFKFTSPLSVGITKHFHAFMLFFLAARRGSPSQVPPAITFSLWWIRTNDYQ